MLGIGRAGDRLRTVLSVLAVGLGVGVVLAIQLANQSSIGSFENSLEEISGKKSAIAGGRPAALFHFRRDALLERPAPG